MSLRQHGLFLLALTFSIFAHFFLFKKIIIVPIEYHPGQKPQIIFLGAILKNVKTPLITTDNYVSKYFVYNDIIPISDEDFRNILVDKPIYYLTDEGKYAKGYPPKTVFSLEPIVEDNETLDIEESGMLKIQPYVPLRFYIK